MNGLNKKTMITAGLCLSAMVFFSASTSLWAAEPVARGFIFKKVLGLYGLQTDVVSLQRGDGFKRAVVVEGANIEPFMFSVGRAGVLVAGESGETVFSMSEVRSLEQVPDIDLMLCYVTAVLDYVTVINSCESGNYACYLMSTFQFAKTIMACAEPEPPVEQ